MKTVILAAGVASRLRPLTDTTPKCLLSVGGKPILRRAIERLQKTRVSEVVIVTGWLENKIHAAVREWFPELRVTFVSNPDFATTNNEYSLWLCRAAVGGESFVMHDGDIVFDQAVLDAVLDSPHENALAMRPSNDLGAEEMKVEIDAGGRVLTISKKIDPRRAAGEVPGVQRFSAATSRRLFERIEERVVGQHIRNEWYEAAMEVLVKEGVPFHVVDVGAHHLSEIDTPEDLAAVDARLRERGI